MSEQQLRGRFFEQATYEATQNVLEQVRAEGGIVLEAELGMNGQNIGVRPDGSAVMIFSGWLSKARGEGSTSGLSVNEADAATISVDKRGEGYQPPSGFDAFDFIERDLVVAGLVQHRFLGRSATRDVSVSELSHIVNGERLELRNRADTQFMTYPLLGESRFKHAGKAVLGVMRNGLQDVARTILYNGQHGTKKGEIGEQA